MDRPASVRSIQKLIKCRLNFTKASDFCSPLELCASFLFWQQRYHCCHLHGSLPLVFFRMSSGGFENSCPGESPSRLMPVQGRLGGSSSPASSGEPEGLVVSSGVIKTRIELLQFRRLQPLLSHGTLFRLIDFIELLFVSFIPTSLPSLVLVFQSRHPRHKFSPSRIKRSTLYNHSGGSCSGGGGSGGGSGGGGSGRHNFSTRNTLGLFSS